MAESNNADLPVAVIEKSLNAKFFREENWPVFAKFVNKLEEDSGVDVDAMSVVNGLIDAGAILDKKLTGTIYPPVRLIGIAPKGVLKLNFTVYSDGSVKIEQVKL